MIRRFAFAARDTRGSGNDLSGCVRRVRKENTTSNSSNSEDANSTWQNTGASAANAVADFGNNLSTSRGYEFCDY